MRVLSLFAGIGGLDLGLEWSGFRTVQFVEKDPACRHWLAQHWPGVPIHDDVHTFSGVAFRGSVDLICGGFPCQPFSVAGKQKGTEDERHLWPEMSRIIREVRPSWVLAENVPGLRTIAADLVLEDLEGQGYTCWPLVVGADDVGAPHRRKRVWIVARRLEDSFSERSRTATGNAQNKGRAVEAGREALPERSEPDSDTRASGSDPRKTLADPSDGRASRDGGHPDSGRPLVGEPTSEGLEVGPRAEDDRGTVREAGRASLAPGGELANPERPGRGTGRKSQASRLNAPGSPRWPSRPGEPQHPWEAPRLAHTHSTRRTKAGGGHPLDAGGQPEQGRGALENPIGQPDRPEARGNEADRPHASGSADRDSGSGDGDGMADSPSEPTRSPGQPRQEPDPRESESAMGGELDGIPAGLAGFTSAHRREALKALGNSVNPWNAYFLGLAIQRIDRERVA